MKLIRIVLLPFVMLLFLGCASSQDKAYDAQEKVHTERLDLVDKYNKCLKDAGDDQVKKDGCEQYLKAADALK
jgi:hypothetical protein